MMKETNCVITNLRGSKLGVIRLSNLAYSREEDFKIKIGDLEINPIGFDTYGHPVLSEEQFEIYQNMKAAMERENKTLKVEVSYNEMPFCSKTELFDTVEGIENAIKKSIKEENLKAFKNMLVQRKQFAFTGKLLHEFLIFGKYFLSKKGKVFSVERVGYKDIPAEMELERRPDFRDTISINEIDGIELLQEVHLPNVNERCVICGKELTMTDIANGNIKENDHAEKGHFDCFSIYEQSVNWQKANEIVDAVYNKAETEIFTEVVDEDGAVKTITRYLYHTADGDISIRIKNKVMEIKWYGKFKPFDFKEIFNSEDVTKKCEGDSKIIHAWSKDKAIEYLLRAKLAN